MINNILDKLNIGLAYWNGDSDEPEFSAASTLNSVQACPHLEGFISPSPIYSIKSSRKSDRAYVLSLGPKIELISGVKRANVIRGVFSQQILLSELVDVNLLSYYRSFQIIKLEVFFESCVKTLLKDVLCAGYFSSRQGNVRFYKVPEFSILDGKVCSKTVNWTTGSFNFDDISSVELLFSAYVEDKTVRSLGRVQIKVEFQCSQ
jgi:hypothetical protein